MVLRNSRSPRTPFLDSFRIAVYLHNHALGLHWARLLLLDIAVKQAAAVSTLQNPISNP